jgi:hypothetical protein
MENTTALTRKATIVPLLPISWELEKSASLPVYERKGLYVENVEGLVKTTHLELWREYLSDNQRKYADRMKIALVHRFESRGHIGKEEGESKSLVDGAAACLQILRPTRSRSQVIQLRFLEDQSVDVISFTQPQDNPPNVPQSDILNTIRQTDISRLRSLLPSFLMLSKSGPENVFRAAKNFLIGYSEISEPFAQVLVWMAGIESMLSSDADESFARKRDRLLRVIDPSWNVYEDSATEEFTKADVRLLDILDDLFSFRNRLVHGGWVPEEWQKREGRPTASGAIDYADVLREASAAILRKLLIDWLDHAAIRVPTDR